MVFLSWLTTYKKQTKQLNNYDSDPLSFKWKKQTTPKLKYVNLIVDSCETDINKISSS